MVWKSSHFLANMMAIKFVGLLFCIFSLWVQLCLAEKARHLKWEVGYVFWSPDCVEDIVIGINGQFPGPTIRAKAGDTIVVEVKNSLPTEGVVIHWHGIRQVQQYCYPLTPCLLLSLCSSLSLSHSFSYACIFFCYSFIRQIACFN